MVFGVVCSLAPLNAPLLWILQLVIVPGSRSPAGWGMFCTALCATQEIQPSDRSASDSISSAVKPMDVEPSLPAGPTAAELSLQEEIKRLQHEKEELHGQYQAQVRDNEQLSHLNQEQEERLLELEKTVQRYNEESVDRQQILESMQSDKATISRALSQNRELKEQLAELQNGFVKLVCLFRESFPTISHIGAILL